MSLNLNTLGPYFKDLHISLTDMLSEFKLGKYYKIIAKILFLFYIFNHMFLLLSSISIYCKLTSSECMVMTL